MRHVRYAVTGAIVVAGMLFTTSASAPAQTATSPLSPGRYTALDQGYTFEIALDREVTTPRLDNLRRYCATLDPADALLSVLRENCLVSVQGYAAGDALGRCASRARCERAVARLLPLASKAIRVTRKANRVIDAEVAAGACRRALRTSAAELRADELLVAALDALHTALRTGSAKARERANRLLASGTRASARVASSTKQRKTFRGACGPPPAAVAAAPAQPGV